MKCQKSHSMSFLLGFLFFSIPTLSAQNNVAQLDQDSVYINQELSETRVIGKKEGTNFIKIDGSALTTQPTVSGGVEGIVRTQMGVSTNSELSSQYRVRGGNFDENMVYLGGVQIYRPFLIRQGEQEGLSIVNPDMVESLSFSAGGFDVSYADKSSSVLNVNYRMPKKAEYSARLSLLGAEAYVGNAMGRVSCANAVRYRTNSYMLGTLDTDGEYDPRFLDAQSYWTLKINSNAYISALGYLATNRYNFKPTDRQTTWGTISDAKKLTIYFEGQEKDRFTTGIAALQGAFVVGRTSFTTTAQYYRSAEREFYDILGEYWLQQAEDAQTQGAVSQSEGIGVGSNLSHARNELYVDVTSFDAKATTKYSSHNTTRYGASYNIESFSVNANEWELLDSAGYYVQNHFLRASRTLSIGRASAYATHLWSPYISETSTLGVELGLRWTYNDLTSESIISPRLHLRYRPQPSMALRFSTGLYANTPMLKEMQRIDGTFNTKLKAQREWHYILGMDYDFQMGEKPFRLTAEAYYKRLSQVNPYSISNVKITYMADNCASGYACGADVRISGELATGVESWLTLSYLKAMEKNDSDGLGYRPRPSDQRFSLSTMLRDRLPNNASIGAVLNLYMATGLPFASPDSFVHSDKNRLPGYKRVDLGIYKDFAILADGTSRWQNGCRQLLLGIDFFNLFDIKNTISYSWVRDIQKHDLAVPNFLTSRRINVRLSIMF